MTPSLLDMLIIRCQIVQLSMYVLDSPWVTTDGLSETVDTCAVLGVHCCHSAE